MKIEMDEKEIFLRRRSDLLEVERTGMIVQRCCTTRCGAESA
jgi:hypothetical protein